MRKPQFPTIVCKQCKHLMRPESGYLTCDYCAETVDLLKTSQEKVCDCLAPHFRTIGSRDVCIKCGGKIVRRIAKKPSRKALALFLEF